jgi:YbgC/YbaW family acyl-CoA thioester hydrolase
MPTRTPMIIEPRHCDLYGHMNNAAYAELLEEGRWDFISKRGYGRDTVTELGQGPVVLELNIRFRRELSPGEKVIVESTLKTLRSRAAIVGQRILAENGELACEAEATLGLFDLESRRLIAPNERWKAALAMEDQP